MNVVLFVYLLGVIITFGVTIFLVQEKWTVGWEEIIGSFVLALFSWEGLLAIMLGYILKRNRKNFYDSDRL